MSSAALDVYVEAFVARCLAARPLGDAMIDEPGIHGLLPDKDGGRTRLLVTDDAARGRRSTLVGDARAGMVTVCAALRSAPSFSRPSLGGGLARQQR